LNIFCFFLRLQLYHKTHHNTLFFKGFNDFIICPDSSFFIEKNFIQKSIHVFKKHPNRLGYGLCCYFHFKTSGNLELLLHHAKIMRPRQLFLFKYWGLSMSKNSLKKVHQ
jgi:hypothetical protein